MNTQTKIEPTNEKGLTREEYLSRGRRINNYSLAGISLSVVLGYGASFFPTIQQGNLPQPKNYQTYIDAQTSLSGLNSYRNALTNIPELPYKTKDLDKSLVELIPSHKLRNLDEAVNLVQQDITRMENENPEYAGFEIKVKAHRKTQVNKTLFYSLGVILAGVLTSICIGGRKLGKLGSNKFKQTPEELE